MHQLRTRRQQNLDFYHSAVLPDEVMELIPIHASTAIDFTLGGAGHAERILTEHRELFLWCVDRDTDALTASEKRLGSFKDRIQLVHDCFSRASRNLLENHVRADFVLADLGVSSFQLDQGERGFSFRSDAPLDMRMDRRSALTAAQVINNWSESDLNRVIKQYGEEPFARGIVRQIIQQREKRPILTTRQLADCIRAAVPVKFQRGRLHPATKTFQAIRIAVNNELEELETLLENAVQLLRPGGRMAIISFHSLEDRIVKQKFHIWENPCQCPRDIPYCICGLKAVGKTLKPKLRQAGEDEKTKNPRSRSARMRAIEKL